MSLLLFLQLASPLLLLPLLLRHALSICFLDFRPIFLLSLALHFLKLLLVLHLLSFECLLLLPLLVILLTILLALLLLVPTALLLIPTALLRLLNRHNRPLSFAEW